MAHLGDEIFTAQRPGVLTYLGSRAKWRTTAIAAMPKVDLSNESPFGMPCRRIERHIACVKPEFTLTAPITWRSEGRAPSVINLPHKVRSAGGDQ
jgi:hypothetical protein